MIEFLSKNYRKFTKFFENFKSFINFREYLEKNKLILEFVAIIIAALAIIMPLREAVKSNKLTYEAIELNRKEMQLNFTPFLNFEIKEYYSATDTVNFLDLIITNYSDAPAMKFSSNLYVDNVLILHTNNSYGDLMPKQERTLNLTLDTFIKEKIFDKTAQLSIDLVSEDIFGLTYHQERGLEFETGKFHQTYSNFCCEEKKNNKCPINLICQK